MRPKHPVMLLGLLVLLGCGPTTPLAPQGPLRIQSPQGLSMRVGQTLTLRVETAPGQVSWRLGPNTSGAAAIDREGKLTATQPGTLWVIANAGSEEATAIIGAVIEPPPLKRFLGEALPAIGAQDGAYVINDQASLERFWQGALRPIEGEPALPTIDFDTASLLALVTGHAANTPLLTHLTSTSPPTLFLTFPDITNPGELRPGGTYLTTYLFETQKLSADVIVSAGGPEPFKRQPIP